MIATKASAAFVSNCLSWFRPQGGPPPQYQGGPPPMGSMEPTGAPQGMYGYGTGQGWGGPHG